MFKYIKWEILDDLRKKKVIYGSIAIVYLLTLILPLESRVLNYLGLPLSIILYGSLVLSFVSGTIKIMKSYENQTFLLESMIPLSPNKILLAKYLLAIIMNVFYCLVFILGLSIILSKADVNLIKALFEIYKKLESLKSGIVLRIFFLLFSSTTLTTSFITLVYLALKSTFPNAAGLKIISFIGGGVILNVLAGEFLVKILKTLINSEIGDIYFSLILLGISAIFYFASLYFVKEKLEIYN